MAVDVIIDPLTGQIYWNDSQNTAQSIAISGNGSDLIKLVGYSLQFTAAPVGTITAANNTTTVTGSNTNFTTLFGSGAAASGAILYTVQGTSIGVISSVTNDTTLVLQSNATGNYNSINFKIAPPAGTERIIFSDSSTPLYPATTGAGLGNATYRWSFFASDINASGNVIFSNPLGVLYGGTGTSSITANSLLLGNGTSAITAISGTAAQFLVANASNIPSFVTLSGDISSNASGVVTIGTNAVSTTKILDNSIITSKILDSNVTEAKLATDSVSTSKILANSVTTVKILDSNVTEAKLATDAVSTSKILANSVTTVKILDSNVTEAKLATDSVSTSKILANSVTTAKILDSNVTEAKLATDSVSTSKILANSVTTAKILDSNVTEAKLATDSVSTSKILANSVTTAKILDSNVTFAKLENASANSVLGRATNSTGVHASIAATLDGSILRLSGTTLGFGAINLSSANSVNGILPVLYGGLGTSNISLVNNGVLIYSTTNSRVQTVTPSANQVLVTDASGVPSFSSDLHTDVTIGTKYIYRADGTDVPILDGGTGASTATSAINNLLPSQGSNGGKYLTTDGSNVSWATVSAGGGSGTVGSGTINRLAYYSGSTTTASAAALTYSDSSVHLGISAQSTTVIPLRITGTTSQNVNLFSIQNSTSTTLVSVNNTGSLLVSNNVASTSTTSGALQVTGGVGITGKIFATALDITNTSTNMGGVNMALIHSYTQLNTDSVFRISHQDGGSLRCIGSDNFGNRGLQFILQPGSNTTTQSQFFRVLNYSFGVPIFYIDASNSGGMWANYVSGPTATFTASAVANVPLTLNGMAGQTGNLITVALTSGGTQAFVINNLGKITVGDWQASIIARAYGGTGTSATPSNGQLLIGNGSAYTVANLTAGTGVGITNGSGSITIKSKRVLNYIMAAGHNPTTGADTAVFRIPESPADGTSSITYTLKNLFVRVETTSAGTSQIKLEKSSDTGAFSASPTQLLTSGGAGSSTVTSNALQITGTTSYEFYTTSFVSTVATGDKIRLNFTAVDSTHANFNINLLLEES